MSDAARCDQCGEYAPRPVNKGGYTRRSLPPGWVFAGLTFAGADTYPDREQGPAGEFCRLKCAATWVRSQESNTT